MSIKNPILTIAAAKAIVNQFDSGGADPSLTNLLESTRAVEEYRPYYVTALFMFAQYRQVVKADEVTFQYDIKRSILGFLSMQKIRDKNLTGIPDNATVSDLENQLDGIENNNESFDPPVAFVI